MNGLRLVEKFYEDDYKTIETGIALLKGEHRQLTIIVVCSEYIAGKRYLLKAPVVSDSNITVMLRDNKIVLDNKATGNKLFLVDDFKSGSTNAFHQAEQFSSADFIILRGNIAEGVLV